MNAKEFLKDKGLNDQYGYGHPNTPFHEDTCKLLEQYADHKTKELQNIINCHSTSYKIFTQKKKIQELQKEVERLKELVKEHTKVWKEEEEFFRQNTITQHKEIQQLKKENKELVEQMEYALNIEDELHKTFVKINELLTKTNKDEK